MIDRVTIKRTFGGDGVRFALSFARCFKMRPRPGVRPKRSARLWWGLGRTRAGGKVWPWSCRNRPGYRGW